MTLTYGSACSGVDPCGKALGADDPKHPAHGQSAPAGPAVSAGRVGLPYSEFLTAKTKRSEWAGFAPHWVPDFLFDFQQTLTDWAIRRGRAAMFADCGLGKSIMQLVWAENVVRHTGKHVLILTPLAVGAQTLAEAEKFGIEAFRSRNGELPKTASIVITNYQQLHHFRPADFGGCAGDESSILKNFDGTTRDAVVEFVRTIPYRTLYTATAAPNDYIELGNSSEALGELGFVDMVSRFFKKTTAVTSRRDEFASGGYRFRGHAERDFWRWVCSWARAVRMPSDIGGRDEGYTLPPLTINKHIIHANSTREGYLLNLSAVGLQEQREERSRTVQERCEAVARIASGSTGAVICWAHLNREADLLEKLIPGAVQVSGADSDEEKEERFFAFQSGEIRALITKPTIAGFGLNWQHCAHQTFFPSHSFEQWYQCVRRSWRFGQTRPVTIDVVGTEGDAAVLDNLERKRAQAEAMFAALVELMNNELHIGVQPYGGAREEIPAWL